MAEDDPVQPEEGGQGGDASEGTAPYAQYLDRIPEEVRGDVEPIFKEWDSNTTRRFQEASEYRKSWEPYEQLGVNQHDPAAVEWALQFYNSLDNPQAIKGWFDQYAQERGLTRQEAQQIEQEYVDPTVAELVQKQLAEHLGPLSSQLEQLSSYQMQQDQQQRFAAAQQFVRSEMDDLKAKHPDEFNETMVEKLIANYIQSDPEHAVRRAFDDWRSIRNQVEKDALQTKADQPPAAERGGGWVSEPGQAKTLKEAAAQAMEQLQGAKSM